MNHPQPLPSHIYILFLLPKHRFPDCDCKRDITQSPYRVKLLNRTTTLAGGTRACFGFNTVPCQPSSPDSCCFADLYKIEIPIRESLPPFKAFGISLTLKSPQCDRLGDQYQSTCPEMNPYHFCPLLAAALNCKAALVDLTFNGLDWNPSWGPAIIPQVRSMTTSLD
jgi:hypothetical protein